MFYNLVLKLLGLRKNHTTLWIARQCFLVCMIYLYKVQETMSSFFTVKSNFSIIVGKVDGSCEV